MSVLRNIEQKIEGLFEGVFGRAFRTNVQPVELARKLVKEMDDHRDGLGLARLRPERVHGLPLARRPRAVRELRGLAPRASCRSTSPSTPGARATCCCRRREVQFETDDDLDDRRVRDRDADGAGRDAAARRAAEPQAAPGATMVYRPRGSQTEAASAEELGARAARSSRSTVDGDAATSSTSGRVVIGRSKDCDIQLADPNVSRRHAEVRQEGAAYWLVDLGSTNGIEVNGQRVEAGEARRQATRSRSARPSSSSGGSTE